jgi:[acyl-carrier-protein] S-malonyltransferase
MDFSFRQGILSNTALIFPGQGSQYVGMGAEPYGKCPSFKRVLDEADDALGFSLSKLSFEGPEDVLRQTANAQPAILAISIAMLTILAEESALEQPLFVAGHSLGEYTALVAAGSLAFADAVRLVRERGRLMEDSGGGAPSGMAAVMGLDDKRLTEICEELLRKYHQSGIQVANYNSPGQTVISGEMQALQEAATIAKQEGAKRVLPLQVSAGFHSGIMLEMSLHLAKALASISIGPARIPLVANVTAEPLTKPDDIHDELVRQTYSPVQWINTVRYMAAHGVVSFVEVGPGKVLSGLVKRITPGVETVEGESLVAQLAYC